MLASTSTAVPILLLVFKITMRMQDYDQVVDSMSLIQYSFSVDYGYDNQNQFNFKPVQDLV